MHASLPPEHPFLHRHAHNITGVLSCFDRIIFRGYLPICHTRGLYGWLHQLGVEYWKFKDFAPKIAERLLQHAKDMAQQHGRPYRYLPTREPMEEQARRLAADDQIRTGLVCVFSCLETCRTFRLKYGADKPRLEPDLRRCTVLYYFFMDEHMGLIHVKLHTWLPLTCQVYVNGHGYLQHQLDKHGLGYTISDNAFTQLQDPEATQRLADRLLKRHWPRWLSRWARLVNPLFEDLLRGQEGDMFSYYWVVDQAEFATDILFEDPAALAELYPALLEHATLSLGSEDVLRFLGRKPSPNLKGEVQTECKRVPLRPQAAEGEVGCERTLPPPASRGRVGVGGGEGEGRRRRAKPQRRRDAVRVSHRFKSNRLKMYDKDERVLRVETVINRPYEFRVRRWHQNKHGETQLAWLPLRKGVAWLWRYAQVGLAANRRYLEALAVVDDPSEARRLLDRACQPAKWKEGRRRALQPLSPHDQALFLAVMRGEHHLHGIRNRDVAQRLYGDRPKDEATRRRHCAHVTRLIQLLRAHGLLAKVPHSRRYRVTAAGRRLMTAAIYVRYKHLPKEILDTPAA